MLSRFMPTDCHDFSFAGVISSGFASRVTSLPGRSSWAWRRVFISNSSSFASRREGVPPPKNTLAIGRSSTKIRLLCAWACAGLSATRAGGLSAATEKIKGLTHLKRLSLGDTAVTEGKRVAVERPRGQYFARSRSSLAHFQRGRGYAAHYLGIPTALDTCVFAMSRVAGWSAHARRSRPAPYQARSAPSPTSIPASRRMSRKSWD